MVESTVNKVIRPFEGVNPSSYALFRDFIKSFFESIKALFTTSWIIASLGQVAHFTSVVIRNVLATSGWVRSAHTAPYAKSAHNSRLTKFAFTLAETLVVMGIIGVVAALTIPNLNQSTGDREKVAKVKKIYANLEDALGRATAVYGPVDEWFNGIDDDDDEAKNKAKRFAERMTEFMKLSKNCEFGDGCINKIYGDIDLGDGFYSFILADGTAMALDGTTVIFDIDGRKGSNTFGKDVFKFMIISIQGEEVTLYPTWYATPENCENTVLKDIDDINDFGVLCAAYWIIKNGNMDYLKCKDELDWETKTSCK